MNQHDVIILGAGASGLWAALTAAKRGRKVLVVDHARKAGRKILIAGGGKCNFTNIELSAANYHCKNRHFCKSALARFTPWHMVEYLSLHDIPWEEREHSQLFCTRSAEDITYALYNDCLEENVRFLFSEQITSVQKNDDLFDVTVTGGRHSAPSLIVALGGSAWPQVGATDAGYKLARQFGHKIIPTFPALVPLMMPSNWKCKNLSGIALPVSISCNKKQYTENMLFTHKGISGPVVLQISAHWKKGDALEIDFLPHASLETLLEESGSTLLLKTVLKRTFPERLAVALIPSELGEKQIAQLSKKDLLALHAAIHAFKVTPTGTEGLKKAEATGGGVDTDSISSKTMESKLCQGLYFTGEVLDVLGDLGGFNLHWAWASGNAAGESV
ncbi:NAD(P)/FAD-dependent oxidoreductase [Halodesulfovibrio sp.]|jgi:predicted Rossmann fold flavoprotein|uniref:NAD(P)/FAD-dependent oxidoreductase n=1 Tax=Halodesulfovibrio sp. TaxID=1912772 RepID=UPI0025F94F11|nr:NAD(P)/FAD-dependent oxidoreductase [Halodesulfovibrio sp.]MCT4626846.1 NAD(P)/FAD-dependent oxidoreductase [Halodesulfovibrio sp.]